MLQHSSATVAAFKCNCCSFQAQITLLCYWLHTYVTLPLNKGQRGEFKQNLFCLNWTGVGLPWVQKVTAMSVLDVVDLIPLTLTDCYNTFSLTEKNMYTFQFAWLLFSAILSNIAKNMHLYSYLLKNSICNHLNCWW